ncbi:crotonobetaine/carnitine-CoA ligase [Shimia gijangensis]|uniref:Crotonobetaine/carnitine-CoA ligase n=1 Tax=Shimia gijangensis TaxID=1470563 RepID=A0A1M6QY76_9RHOB|nr:AMP-binding protein [Shimia gijangensis]SHK25038.1 crotonobetaine/carnitine-CoA ligase [Shimia gijangensis]
MSETIAAFFDRKAEVYSDNALLCVPQNPDRDYHPDGYEITYSEARDTIERWQEQLRTAGYGHGHRIAVLLANRPEMLLLKIALNGLGISWVPINPDYRASEIAYLLEDSRAELIVTTPTMMTLMQAGHDAAACDAPIIEMDTDLPRLPMAPTDAPLIEKVSGATEASLIYTSGTTGRPKGCILSHDYEISMGLWYASQGGLIDFKEGQDRLYCPLPLFHLNAAVLVLFCMVETGGCQIIPERFRASAWWRELSETKATVAHYLGIVIPALMNREKGDWDYKNKVRFAVGAGVEPTLHGPFEERFGFPLIEVWGMTEMCRVLACNTEPRMIDTRAMGRPSKGLDVQVWDEADQEVPRGTAGEMVIRHSAETPRRGAFSGYLNLPEVTEDSWRGGWFHTGDTVMMDESDMVFFLDRKKNIIRRSGENIAAAEIEACLQEHSEVERVAVLAVEDPLRDEEVMACIMGKPDAELAENLFNWCFERLTYYKAPGWIRFVDDIPVTGTQKIQKHAMFAEGEDPTNGAFDFRDRKKRSG